MNEAQMMDIKGEYKEANKIYEKYGINIRKK